MMAVIGVDEDALEAEIKAKGLNAPRITPEHIDALIVKEFYQVVAGTTLTFCVLTLLNGFHVTGVSAAASPENFDAEIGRRIARSNAREKIWELEGYYLRHVLSAEKDATLSDETLALIKSKILSPDAPEPRPLSFSVPALQAFISERFPDGNIGARAILKQLANLIGFDIKEEVTTLVQFIPRVR